jgi:hypothetical protein
MDWAGSLRVYLNVSDLYVAWEVYRGNLLSAFAGPRPDGWSPISLVLASAIRQGQELRLQHELTMERVRVAEFPASVSRLRAMYYFEDERAALQARETWGDAPEYFTLDHLAEVGFVQAPRMSRHDSMWIDKHMWRREPFSQEDEEWIRRYWSGQTATNAPLWEILAEGSLWVFGTELRTRAHDLIAEAQPTSLPMLELARVAAAVDSSLGHCTPLVGGMEIRRFLQYFMDMRDAHNPDFLARLREYDGPKNTAELNAQILEQEGLRVPDFMAMAFDFQPPPDLAALLDGP